MRTLAKHSQSSEVRVRIDHIQSHSGGQRMRSPGLATCNLLSKVIRFAYVVIKSNGARSARRANGICRQSRDRRMPRGHVPHLPDQEGSRSGCARLRTLKFSVPCSEGHAVTSHDYCCHIPDLWIRSSAADFHHQYVQ